MKYKAIEQATKPFITWVSTDEPLGALVMNEENIPAYQFGVCPLKIHEGELVSRTAMEMEEFEQQWIIEQAKNTQNSQQETLSSASFIYDGIKYPLTPIAITRYRAIESDNPATYTCKDITGTVHNLTSDDTTEFIEKCNKMILGLTV